MLELTASCLINSLKDSLTVSTYLTGPYINSINFCFSPASCSWCTCDGEGQLGIYLIRDILTIVQSNRTIVKCINIKSRPISSLEPGFHYSEVFTSEIHYSGSDQPKSLVPDYWYRNLYRRSAICTTEWFGLSLDYATPIIVISAKQLQT